MLAELDLGAGGRVYGLGERFSAFIKHGQTVHNIWNDDSCTRYTEKDLIYIPSNRYGLFVNHPSKVSLEVQSEQTTRVNICMLDQKIKYFMIYDKTSKGIL